MMKHLKLKAIFIPFIFFFLLVTGCENTDMQLATEAGLDALKAATLSDEEVRKVAMGAAAEVDGKNKVGGAADPYGRRLKKLVSDHQLEDGIEFNYKVYLNPTVNAFAMADGTIRVYSGLMDMMDDGELRFVIGHEMGHVVKKHIKKKLMLAYAGSAVRKSVAARDDAAGDIARSALGGLIESAVNAQFSQQEEREADDYGVTFLQQKGYEQEKAISALRKLATLGNDHSFLSSHPAPGQRADRIETGINGPEMEEVEGESTLWTDILSILSKLWSLLMALIADFI